MASSDKNSGSAIFDEWNGFDGKTRAALKEIAAWIDGIPAEDLARKRDAANIIFERLGITFMVYGREGRTEQLIPFDVIPRVLAQKEWNLLETGSIQRVRALNQFLWDIYHDAEILRAGIVPADLIYVNDFYQPQMIGFDPPGGIYTHIAGIDIVRTGEEDFFVLEDNLRSPSGVSYMMENREAMMRLFPEQTKRINALMMTCGLYDAVGDFVFRVGMPAKSGVGGGIAGVIPGEISVCVWSPGLDESGNSLLGVWALERFVGETGLSVF